MIIKIIFTIIKINFTSTKKKEGKEIMEIQTCSRCIMNNSADPYIYFDENGQKELARLLKEIKDNRVGEYDCLMGLSGGLDSSYLAYLGSVKWGLKIIAVHIDDGFDTEISKGNIEKLCKAAGIKLINIKPDAKQFNSLTRAYLDAGVPNIAAPQDNILFASLYDYARKNKIKYFLSGGNFALESILQKGNTYDALDAVNIKDIFQKFGKGSIDKLKLLSKLQRYLDNKVLNIKTISPLNYINYSKENAFKELSEFCDFQYYGSKHLENYLTAFVQLYWLPQKFNVDKRTSHLSSLVISGQLTREDALLELNKPVCTDEYKEKLLKMIKDAFSLSEEEFIDIMNGPSRQHTEFKTDRFANFVKKILK